MSDPTPPTDPPADPPTPVLPFCAFCEGAGYLMTRFGTRRTCPKCQPEETP